MTLDERIKALNDIDQEFDNDVIRGFGEALNIIDELRERIKKLEDELKFEQDFNSSDWFNPLSKSPKPNQICIIKGHWFTSKKRAIESNIKYDEDEGWNDQVNNSFVIDGWKPQQTTEESSSVKEG